MFPHLQRNISLRPVLDVLKLNIRIPVDKVDADQLLAALTLEARQALTNCSASFLLTGGAILTLNQLTGRSEGHLTKLTTERTA